MHTDRRQIQSNVSAAIAELRTPAGRRGLLARKATEENWLDFKETLSTDRDAKRKLRADVAAMATFGGGLIVFGARTDPEDHYLTELSGVENAGALRAFVETLLAECMLPPLTDETSLETIELDATRSLVLLSVRGRAKVRYGLDDPKSGESRWSVYTRSNARNKPLTPSEIEDLVRQEAAPSRRSVLLSLAAASALSGSVGSIATWLATHRKLDLIESFQIELSGLSETEVRIPGPEELSVGLMNKMALFTLEKRPLLLISDGNIHRQQAAEQIETLRLTYVPEIAGTLVGRPIELLMDYATLIADFSAFFRELGYGQAGDLKLMLQVRLNSVVVVTSTLNAPPVVVRSQRLELDVRRDFERIPREYRAAVYL